MHESIFKFTGVPPDFRLFTRPRAISLKPDKVISKKNRKPCFKFNGSGYKSASACHNVEKCFEAGFLPGIVGVTIFYKQKLSSDEDVSTKDV